MTTTLTLDSIKRVHATVAKLLQCKDQLQFIQQHVTVIDALQNDSEVKELYLLKLTVKYGQQSVKILAEMNTIVVKQIYDKVNAL